MGVREFWGGNQLFLVYFMLKLLDLHCFVVVLKDDFSEQ